MEQPAECQELECIQPPFASLNLGHERLWLGECHSEFSLCKACGLARLYQVTKDAAILWVVNRFHARPRFSQASGRRAETYRSRSE